MLLPNTPQWANFPLALQSYLQQRWDELVQRCSAFVNDFSENETFMQEAMQVWAGSEFVIEYCICRPQALVELLQSSDLKKHYTVETYQKKLKIYLETATDELSLGQRLRQFRYREMVRIAWRDLAGKARVAETLADLSALADSCICQTVTKLYGELTQRLGTPYDEEGNAQPMFVVALGKLGGCELNFSSDIDLIFCYNQSGETQGGPRAVANEQFFTQLARALIKAFNEITELGFVFRVDMRLRPYGDSGPLVMSLPAMEAYYQEQGREWERYALLKARIVNPENDNSTALQSMIQRFVYRRYVDYGVIEALRDLKMKMDRETRQRGLEDNIKLGFGGIREVEFIVQALQLIRGGKEPYLQTQQFLQAVMRIDESHGLDAKTVKLLRENYLFLRNVENHLQMMTDRQTQNLPTDSLEKSRLIFSLGFSSWEEFHDKLHKVRNSVRSCFMSIVREPLHKEATLSAQLQRVMDLKSVWLGEYAPDRSFQVLMEAGFKENAAVILQKLTNFKKSHKIGTLRIVAAKRLDDLIPLLLNEIASSKESVAVLERVIILLEAIVGRSAYLALLLENHKALHHLVQLCSASAWIAEELSRFPLLLDELLNANQLYAPIDAEVLTEELKHALTFLPSPDFEQQMECLRQFKLTNQLRIAAIDVMEKQSVTQVSRALSDLATVIITAVKSVIWQRLVAKYGCPIGAEGSLTQSDFAIIAYGKLGGYELSYDSDLDLVFLYSGEGAFQTNGEKSLSNAEFFIRLGQQLIHFLSMRTVSGELYKLDMRLRPSGASGLLVTNINAFIEYQRHSAWTWEHQAMVRARVIGGGALVEQFNAIRYEVLVQKREPAELKEQIINMRERMRQSKVTKIELFEVKHGAGGITDIEFMVQYLVLLFAHFYPDLSRDTSTESILQRLAVLNLLNKDDIDLLIKAYQLFRVWVHRIALQSVSLGISKEELEEIRKGVSRIWKELMNK